MRRFAATARRYRFVAVYAAVAGGGCAAVAARFGVLPAVDFALVIGALRFAAWMHGRLGAQDALRARARELEALVAERTELLEGSQRLAKIGSFRWDARTDTNTWTDTLYRIYGLEPGDEAPSFEAYMSKVHPDFVESVRRTVEHAVRARAPFEHEYRINHPSGEERWVHAYGVIVTDESGAMIGMQGTCQDITDRKRSEQATRASEERFRLLIESAPIAALVVDADGRIMLVNDELNTMLGYSACELVGHSVDELVPDDLRLLHDEHRKAYILDPRRRPMGSGLELQARRKDGTLVPVDINISPIPTEQGLQMVAAVRDITEQKRIEETLRSAYERERDAAEHLRALDDSKTVFLEAVSHELRTPLTVIFGVAELMQRGELDLNDEQTPALLRSLYTSAHRLQSLLDDLLDLDRLRRGVIIKPSRRPTPLADLLASVVNTLELGGHTVMVDAHEVVANVDPAQTERIVENLVANALKHTPAGTCIWVRAEHADGGTMIIVEDSGPGVPLNIKDALFEPFVKDTRGHVPGTGVGLSLVQRFAQLHGGGAWVEDRPGGGASFRVYLPDEAHLVRSPGTAA